MIRITSNIPRLVAAAAVILAMSGCLRGGAPAEFRPAGNWVDDLGERIRASIADPRTRDALLEVVEEVGREKTAFDEATGAYLERIAALDRDYRTTRAQFEAEIQRYDEARVAYRSRLFDLRFRMRELTNKDQWDVLADIDETLYAEWRYYAGL